MRIFLLVFLFSIFLFPVYSQNGVRIAATTGTADASAMLDVISTTKGFLVPRMSLTGPALTNPLPVTSPAVGLLVYNLGASGIASPGFYYWTGSAWVQLSAGALSGSGTLNYVAKWTSTSAVGNSQIFDNATNVGINTSTPNFKLDVQQDMTIDGDITPGKAQVSIGGVTTPGKRMLLGYDTNGNGFAYIKSGNYAVSWTPLSLQPNGGNVGIGNTLPYAKLYVVGGGAITTGSNYANVNNNMASGSLTLGGITTNFGGGSGWGTTTAGLLLECLDNTEIGIHDSGTRVASAIYYQGETINLMTMGRDMGWGKTSVAVATLTGTGYRPVYADATGILKVINTNTVVFSNTGGDQSWVVPAGVTSITVKLWGAGGGAGYYGGWDGAFNGGGGGYTVGTIAVTAGQTYTVMVGSGGTSGNNATTTDSYGGGAKSCHTSDCRYGGQGGGRSAIRLSGTELLTAGGGGGGGSSRDWTYYRCEGGAGGGLVGQSGAAVQTPSYAATGGTQSAGGTGGLNGAAGTQYTGGISGGQSYGGGGGGGWWGGGGGTYQESNLMGGGGGGSGYISGANVTNAYTIGGWNHLPGGECDPNYVAGIGIGGMTQYHSVGTLAGNGRVVIIY